MQPDTAALLRRATRLLDEYQRLNTPAREHLAHLSQQRSQERSRSRDDDYGLDL